MPFTRIEVLLMQKKPKCTFFLVGGSTLLQHNCLQVDTNLIEGLIFPRASALAERLWTNPEEGYLQAESRMFLHRDRLVRHGIRC